MKIIYITSLFLTICFIVTGQDTYKPQKLKNTNILIDVIIDNNGFQQTGSNKEIMNSGSLREKWASFGWETAEIDGHNVSKLFNYFEDSKKISACFMYLNGLFLYPNNLMC